MSTYSDAVLALSPSSYWRFEQGATLTDSGSGGITLTSVGSPIGTASLVPSENPSGQRAFNLNGSDYFTAGDNYEFTGDINWSLMMWVRPTGNTFGSGFQRLLEKRDTGGTFPGWHIYGQGANNLQFDIDFGATTEGLGTTIGIDDAETHFLCWTYVDATTDLKVYDAGVEIDDKASWTTAPGFPASGTAPFTIGASSAGGAGFVGAVDEVAVWSGTALTAPQIANLYAIGSTPFVDNNVMVARHGVGLGRW